MLTPFLAPAIEAVTTAIVTAAVKKLLSDNSPMRP